VIATLTPLRAGDVTAAVRRRYIARIKNAQKAIGRLEKSAARSLLADLRWARNAILGSLTDATPFGTWNAGHAIKAVEEAMAQYVEQGTGTLRRSFDSAWQLGTERVGMAAKTVGIDVTLPTFQFGIDRKQLEFAQGWAGDLIQAESDSILRGVSREVRLSFAGGQTKEQLIQRVRTHITKPLRFGTRRKRAETIVRTEVNRIHNAAAQSARMKMSAENVKVRKQWLHTGAGKTPRADHLALDGVTVDVDKPFPYPGLPRAQWPMYPLDPVLPAEASINCHCTTIEIFEVLDEADIAGAVTA